MVSIYDKSSIGNNSLSNRVNMKHNLIYLIVIISIILMIHQIYKTQLTTKTYLLNIYLYTFLALFSVIVGALNFMNLIPPQKQWIMLLFLFLVTLPILCTISMGNKTLSHIGFALFLLVEAFAFSILLNNLDPNTNINTALIITSILFISFSLIVYYSSDEMILKMAGWQKYLLALLIIAIISQFILLFFKKETATKYHKYYNYFIIVIFIGFILSDTSMKAYKSKVITGSHNNVNYPSEVMSLILDYLNIFSSTLQIMNN